MRILLITENSFSWPGCFLFALNALPCRGEPLYYFLDPFWSRFPVARFPLTLLLLAITLVSSL